MHLPIPGRASGSAALFEAGSTTTPCPATSGGQRLPRTRRSGTGIRRFGAAASARAWTGSGCTRLAHRWLPPAQIMHPWPAALRRSYPSQEPSAVVLHAGICAGGAARKAGPYRDRNQRSGVPTLSTIAEGNTAGGAIASRWRTPRGQRTRACTEPPCARTGRSRGRPPVVIAGRAAAGNAEAVILRCTGTGSRIDLVVPAKPPNNARGWGGGGGGGKGTEPRGTRTSDNTPRTQCRAGRAKRAGSCAPRWREGTRKHGSPRCCITSMSDRLRAAYWALQPEGRAGGGRRDVGRLRAGPARSTSGTCTRRVHSGALPGEAVPAGVHPEAGRAAASARDCDGDCYRPCLPALAYGNSGSARSRAATQVELVVHGVTRVRFSGRWRPGSRRSGGAGTGSSSACA